MIEFAIQMPVEAKLSMPWYKDLLRKGMAGTLPEDVCWRTNTGGHPGWRFYERLIESSAQVDTHIWNSEHFPRNLCAWIDTTSMKPDDMLKYSTEYQEKFKLFTLAVLAQWLYKGKIV
jgi:hypothetical protein